MNVTARIVSASQDEKQMELLLSDYTAFIKACIAKYGSSNERNITVKIDDLLTVGQMGFVEAVKLFNPERGNFFSFASLIIKRRLTEEQKQRRKWSDKVVYLNMNEPEDQFIEESVVQFRNDTEKSDLLLEISQLKERLSGLKIDFLELSRLSPKHKSSKELCLRVVMYLLNNHDMCEMAIKRGILPYNLILRETHVNEKILERHKKYILAVSIIMKEDYPRLKAYIPISI